MNTLLHKNRVFGISRPSSFANCGTAARLLLAAGPSRSKIKPVPTALPVQNAPGGSRATTDHLMRYERFAIRQRQHGTMTALLRRTVKRSRRHLRFWCAVTLLAGAVLLVARLTEAPGQDAVATASPSNSERTRDARLTLRARQALQQDPGLAALSLVGVSVRGSAATLWGSVPAADLSRRAEALVRQVPGIFEVRNELHIDVPNDPVVEFLNTAPPRPAKNIPEVAWLANRPPAILTGRPDEPPPSPAANGVGLLPPIAVASPRPAAATSSDLIGAIHRLQQAEPRFQRVQIDVQGGIVRLGGIVDRWEDMFELAQAVARLPGVDRVILQDVKTANRR